MKQLASSGELYGHEPLDFLVKLEEFETGFVECSLDRARFGSIEILDLRASISWNLNQTLN